MNERTEYVFPDESEQEIKDSKQVEVKDEDNIEIVDDTPEKDRGRKPLEKEVTDPTEEELAQYSEGVKKRISELTHAKHDERRAKEAIERERDEAFRAAQAAYQENEKLKAKLAENQNSYVSQSQKLVENELIKAKADLKAAHESGDTDAFIAAQEALNAAQIQLDKVKSFKPKDLQKDSTTDRVPPQQVQNPPIPQADAKAKAWKEKNSWFGDDEAMTSLALGLHNKLLRQGYDLQSDRYYNTIDTEMRKRFPEAFEDAPKSLPKTPANVVAPSDRATSAKKVRLTQTQVQIAKRLGVPLENYARQVAALEKQNG